MDTEIIKAVADETRLKLLNEIKQGEICACELPRRVGISQPAVSQHLKVLLGARLVNMKKDGAKRLYSTSEKGRHVLTDISKW